MRFDNDDDDDGGGVIQETIDRIHYNLLRALSARERSYIASSHVPPRRRRSRRE